MSDRIEIRGIKAYGYHGVFEGEARDGQDFIVDISINIDLQRASMSDELGDTVNYAEVAELVVGEIEGERVELIERLAGRIADHVMKAYPLISSLAVAVHKPQAPISASVDDIVVTVHRNR